MKTLLIVVLSLMMTLLSNAETSMGLELDDSHLDFHYSSQDGEFQLDCTHKRIRDLPDWEVNCKNDAGIRKVFVAHVVLNKGRKLEAPQKPSRWYELLYWVTDRKAPQAARFYSTSLNLQLTEVSQIQSFQLHQGVENDYASLILSLKVP